ncbi:(d)CMP kinase [Elizabethkingia meningoseptica]|uniref:(d)CMP kinase n=1 Tax=Elizabethkingia meningoseptica TaxID=238 RepID=UPI0023B1C7FC|nr:(d)CMP kinase [Elizabethkingia meningoseptica]MDE5439218.1 (d)CMP kinase [Elizabethkingia meningoseptica]MDE5509223.1 (d)CMP kinase [Elizabethkingia meningoseptica]MDE5516654.1 (d)CMP kinase [Elizabethkingia meningoseptica]MDE5527559.1 (d)CMP kinase [Elizabethkingia meningoseptica]MDE5530893.1 (d)CMP kinase [Elizabethkingia meningoseptica]
MKKKPVIAIDGFSSTGKSSISKIIAQKLDIIHMDTGALYRGITVYALRHHLENNTLNIPALINDLENIDLEFRNIDGNLQLFLNDKNIDTEIRDPKVSDYVSEVAKQPEVRAFLLSRQRKMAENGGIVMDGRDIGTVVLPNADYKFFLTASPDERAVRRYKELLASGLEADLEEVKANLLMRDKIDSERETSPLKQAEDAILIDNTLLDKEQTIALILSYIQ